MCADRGNDTISNLYQVYYPAVLRSLKNIIESGVKAGIMVERGRSLNWLADQVGITNVNLSKIKNNRVSAIRFSALAAICAALDCQPGDILEYVDGISGDADDANSK